MINVSNVHNKHSEAKWSFKPTAENRETLVKRKWSVDSFYHSAFEKCQSSVNREIKCDLTRVQKKTFRRKCRVSSPQQKSQKKMIR